MYCTSLTCTHNCNDHTRNTCNTHVMHAYTHGHKHFIVVAIATCTFGSLAMHTGGTTVSEWMQRDFFFFVVKLQRLTYV